MKKLIRWSAISLAFIVAFLGIMFLHFYIITEDDYVVAQTVEQNPSIPHIHMGTMVLHAETFGSDTNDVVVVLHGGPGMDFRYLLPLKELANDYFVVFYDQRGTGLSPRVGAAELSMEQMRSDLHQIVQSYAGSRKVNLIGHSWGAFLASMYTNAYPDKVNKVILAEPWILPLTYDPEITEAYRYWFESLHVKGPDRQASSDYFLSTQMQRNQEATIVSPEYWRYGSLARKTLLNDLLSNEAHTYFEYLNKNQTLSDKILYISGANHSVPTEKHLIDPLDFSHEIKRVTIEGAEYLFGENIEVSVLEIRKFLNENAL
jgi:pimeloyl-ACP methyl ester carboxylesterase